MHRRTRSLAIAKENAKQFPYNTDMDMVKSPIFLTRASQNYIRFQISVSRLVPSFNRHDIVEA
jgi:hypothetical protein